jgi:hypothetical protein
VSWRESDSHWGWAPLPFAARYEVGVGFRVGGRNWGVDFGFGLGARDYCFVSRDHFYDSNFVAFVAPREQVNVFFGRTTIIQNNITVVNGNVIVHGPAVERVREFSHRDVRELRLTDNHIGAGMALNGASREDRASGELHIYRPHVNNVAVETPLAIAARQVAVASASIHPSADPRVLAAAARAEELRERHFAVQDARRQEVVTRQSARLEDAAARQSEFDQLRLNKAIAGEQNAQRKAELASKLAQEQKAANDARLRKVELEKQAADQRRLADEAARQQIKVARATSNAESARQAQQAKAQLAAERAAREQSQRNAALQAEKVAAEHKAAAAGQNAAKTSEAEAQRAQAEATNKARLEAARAAAESRRAATEAARTNTPAVTHQPATVQEPPKRETHVNPPAKGNEKIDPKTGRPYGQ